MRLTVFGAAAVLMLLGPWVGNGVTEECSFSYLDDFSTDRSIDDSYLHSPFVSELPDVYLNGLLIFQIDHTGDRSLRFQEGYLVDAKARLYYLFPINPVEGHFIRDGHLEFDLSGSPDSIYFQMQIYADTTTIHEALLNSPGHHRVDISPSVEVEQVEIRFIGSGCRLDNLSVCLDTVTQIAPSTWGRIKSHYH